MKTIASHSGTFHSDEVAAIALVRIFLDYGQAPIYRSRDANTINRCDLVIDVGEVYSPETGHFDHHHFDKDHKLYGKSSAGLMWDYIKSTVDLAIPYTSIDYLVKDIDDQDTGVKLQGHYHFCNIVGSFNTEEVYSEDQDTAFLAAVDFVQLYLQRMMAKAHISCQQSQLAANTPIQDLQGMKIACIPLDGDYIAKHHFIGLADILISWDNGQNAWTVLMVPTEKDPFASKYALVPANDPQELFTHKAGFIGKYRTKPDGTIYFRTRNGSITTSITMEVK